MHTNYHVLVLLFISTVGWYELKLFVLRTFIIKRGEVVIYINSRVVCKVLVDNHTFINCKNQFFFSFEEIFQSVINTRDGESCSLTSVVYPYTDDE